MDGTDINAVDRSKQTYDKGMKLLASGDDRGKVRILEYPCLVKNSQGVVGRGHSSHVTNVQFNLDDQYLLSTGGEDQTILQWQVQAEL
jgi:WD40 repeat protein